MYRLKKITYAKCSNMTSNSNITFKKYKYVLIKSTVNRTLTLPPSFNRIVLAVLD